MLLRFECETARLAPAGDFDVGGLVRAFGHFVGGQVGDRGEQRVELSADRALLILHRRERLLQLGDFRLEHFGGSRVALAHRRADRFRCLVAAGERFLHPCPHRAPVGIEGEYFSRLGRKAASRQGGVESLGIFADRAQVVHGPRLCPWSGGIVQRNGLPGRHRPGYL